MALPCPFAGYTILSEDTSRSEVIKTHSLRVAHLFFLVLLTVSTSVSAAGLAAIVTVNHVQELFDKGDYRSLDRALSAAQIAFEGGSITEGELLAPFRAFYLKDPALQHKFDVWVKTYPQSYVAHLARAIYYRNVGGKLRGGAYQDGTSDQQLAYLQSYLSRAIDDLQVSIDLTKSPILSYFEQIEDEGFMGAPDLGRRSFEKATKLEPTSFIARARYMYNLQTRWGGSLAEMQAFRQECNDVGLSPAQLKLLDSILAEEQGWVHLHIDEDPVAAEADYRRTATLDPKYCLYCFYLEASTYFVQRRQYLKAIPLLSAALSEKAGDMHTLGVRGDMYRKTENMTDAVADWTKAAEGGDSYAQGELGRLYMVGVPGILVPDSAIGIRWLRMAAAQGNAAAIQNLSIATRNMGPQSQ